MKNKENIALIITSVILDKALQVMNLGFIF